MGLMISLLDYSDVVTEPSVAILSVALLGLLAALITRRGAASASLNIWLSIAFSSLALVTHDYLR